MQATGDVLEFISTNAECTQKEPSLLCLQADDEVRVFVVKDTYLVGLSLFHQRAGQQDRGQGLDHLNSWLQIFLSFHSAALLTLRWPSYRSVYRDHAGAAPHGDLAGRREHYYLLFHLYYLDA